MATEYKTESYITFTCFGTHGNVHLTHTLGRRADPHGMGRLLFLRQKAGKRTGIPDRTLYLLPVYSFIAYFLAEYILYLMRRKPQAIRIYGHVIYTLAIIGKYIGKIYTETKRRPRYFIEKTVGD